jgi:hypothetical protein
MARQATHSSPLTRRRAISKNNCAVTSSVSKRLKDHHDSRIEPVRQRAAANYVIAASKGREEGEPKGLSPVIIAENSSDVPELSVGEAVMQLDISTVAFVLFRNARDGGLNVVYRRDDGNIGWIDPRPSSSS